MHNIGSAFPFARSLKGNKIVGLAAIFYYSATQTRWQSTLPSLKTLYATSYLQPPDMIYTKESQRMS